MVQNIPCQFPETLLKLTATPWKKAEIRLAEIGDFHLAGIGHHDVRRLHVAVDHAMRMRDEQATR